MKLMVYIYYWRLFFKTDNLKSIVICQKNSFNSFSLFYIFSLSPIFLLSLFKLSCAKKHYVYNLYHVSYTLSFCYLMYYIVSEIYIGGLFLEDCFYCYSQQIISTATKESRFPITLSKSTRNTEPRML